MLEVDEFTDLYSSWAVYDGQIPYGDFFYYHTPLWPYFGSIFFSFFGEGIFLIFIFRYVFLFVSMISLFLIYKISRLFYSRHVSFLSSFLSSFFLIFMITTTEIRADVVPFFLLLVAYYFILLKRQTLLFSAISGVCFSLAFLFKQSHIFGFFSILIFLFLCRFGQCNRLLRLKKRTFMFIVSFTLPIAIVFLYFHFLGGLYSLLKYAFFDTYNIMSCYPPSYTSLYSSFLANSLIWIFGITFIIYKSICFFWRFYKNRQIYLEDSLLISFYLFSVTLIINPAIYGQDILILLPFLAIYAASFLNRVIGRLCRLRNKFFISVVLLFILGMLVIPPIFQLYNLSSMDKGVLNDQLNRIELISNLTSEKDKVFDSLGGTHLFRGHASYFINRIDDKMYGCLLNDSYYDGLMGADKIGYIINNLEENSCKVIVPDFRILDFMNISSEFANYVGSNYVLIDFDPSQERFNDPSYSRLYVRPSTDISG